MVTSIQSFSSIAASYQSAALSNASARNRANAGAQSPAAATGSAPLDLVTISPAGKLLANDDLLPTPANLQKSSAGLTQDLNAALAQAGISTSPPVSFSVDANTSQVTVTGDRPDAKKIEDLINNDPSLKSEFHNVSGEAGTLSVFQQGLKAVDAYLAANTKSQLDAVISQYYSGGPPQPGNITLAYNGTSIQANANGKPL